MNEAGASVSLDAVNSDRCHEGRPLARRALSRFALALSAVVMLHGLHRQSVACLRPDGSNDEDYIAAGAAMQGKLVSGRVWYSSKTNDVIIGSYNLSATYYNERCVLTAAHNLLTNPNSNYKVVYCEIGTGPNNQTNRGTIVPSFKYLIHPGLNTSDSGAGTDLAIICLAASLPGTNATIGSASGGQVVNHGGFGVTATPSTPMTNDGNARGWRAAIDNFVDDRYSPTYYAQTRFNQVITMNGKGLSGDSGGPVYNDAGELIGLNKAQIGGMASSGVTIFLKLAQPAVFDWLQQNTTNLAPNPPSLALNGVGALSLTGDTNQIYGILSSTNLVDWQEIGLVTNFTGTVSFQDTNAASFPARFYRAAAK